MRPIERDGMSIRKEKTWPTTGPRKNAHRRTEAKRDHILKLASQTMLQHGYQLASMDLIAQRAGVSKATLYSYFSDKEALFSAVISRLSNDILESIDNFRISELAPYDALYQIGSIYLELALLPSSLKLHRIIVAEAPRHPALGNLFYRNGPLQAVDVLARYLCQQPGLQIANSHRAAELFLGMIVGHVQLRSLLGVRDHGKTKTDRDKIIQDAVHIFLHGILLDMQHPISPKS